MANELDLVRRYEPLLRFSTDRHGWPENFFPVAAGLYTHRCGLRREHLGWVRPPNEALLRDLSRIAGPDECYLSFAAGDVRDMTLLKLLDYGLELARPSQPVTAPEDLAAEQAPVPLGPVMPRILTNGSAAEGLEYDMSQVGITVDRSPVEPDEVDRLVTAASTGQRRAARAPHALEWAVPQGFAALPAAVHQRALEKYKPLRNWERYPPVYYYRVSRDGPFRILHYWFLYAYNDWAAHGGSNDHEGDWEAVFVVLDTDNRPQHVIASRHVRVPHLYEPLTLPWDEVERVDGTHPVIYVGCGSHASYLRPDTYRVLIYQDYALGDDTSIGPGGDQAWRHPYRLSGKRWNHRFSGRWGSLVKRWSLGVIPGTLGPTGPAHKKTKWSNPARWAGLL